MFKFELIELLRNLSGQCNYECRRVQSPRFSVQPPRARLAVLCKVRSAFGLGTFGKVIFLDDLLAQGFGDGFAFRVDLQFFINIAEMKGNGVDADLELVSGGFVAVSFGE